MGLGPMAMGPGAGFLTLGTERGNVAGGQTRVRQSEYQGPVEKKGIKGFLNSLTGKKKTTGSTYAKDAEGQQIGGAEAMCVGLAAGLGVQRADFCDSGSTSMRSPSKSVPCSRPDGWVLTSPSTQLQIAQFSSVYSKVRSLFARNVAG